MRPPEPVRQNPVLGNAVEHSIRADNRGIYRSREHQDAHNDDKSAERQPRKQRPCEIHGQAADRVVVEVSANVVRDNHHGKKCHAGREDEAVKKNDEPGFFQIAQLGVLDLPIDLGHGLFAAHGQNRMTQPNQDSDQPDGIGQPAMA